MLQSKKSVANGWNVTKWEKGTYKTSGHVVTKSLKPLWDGTYHFFMRKRDMKYVRTKCSPGTKCHMVGLAKNALDKMFSPWKVFKKEINGWTDNLSTSRSDVTVDIVKPRSCIGCLLSEAWNVSRMFQTWTYSRQDYLLLLTPFRAAGGMYDFRNFEQV